jgi:hypothetical protein
VPQDNYLGRRLNGRRTAGTVDRDRLHCGAPPNAIEECHYLHKQRFDISLELSELPDDAH